MGDQKKGNRRGEGGQEEEEAKCPFGFKGPNPHGSLPASRPQDRATTIAKEEELAVTSAPPQQTSVAHLEQERTTADCGERCPWPFIFFHDPLTGLKDWQSWFVIGL